MFLQWLIGIARRFVAWLESLAPKPPPPPPDGIKSAAFWLAEFKRTWTAEYASIYHDWPERDDRLYFVRYLIDGTLGAWLAAPADPYWRNVALDLADRWAKTTRALPNRANPLLVDMMTGCSVAWLLDEMQAAGVKDMRTPGVLSTLIAIWEQHWPASKRPFTHGAWRSLWLAWHLYNLDADPTRKAQYAELIGWALPLIGDQYEKTPLGWRYMFDDSSQYDPTIGADGYNDWSHAQDDGGGVARLAGMGHAFGLKWLPRMLAVFHACYSPDAVVDGEVVPGGRFSYCVDGTNRGNHPKNGDVRPPFDWPHVCFEAHAELGALDVSVQQALENYASGKGSSYRAPIMGRLAWNAARLASNTYVSWGLTDQGS